jgi:CRISPR-associated endonuclease Csn1
LEQRYRSPYTGCVIPLSKLFTSAYQVEHIIPRAIYLDDSLSNKVICESAVNKLKDKALAFNFIKDNENAKVATGFGGEVTLFNLEKYKQYIDEHYNGNKAKRKKLLAEEIPTTMIDRQLNDTRYISSAIMKYLSNIVREENEQEVKSKNVHPTTGGITATLRNDWGLNDIWNDIITPRFKRLNEMTNSNHYGKINPKTNSFLPEVPLAVQKGFNKKRIDHRHHALDAIVIAFTNLSQVNYLNNMHAKGKNAKASESERYEVFRGLRSAVCEKKKEGDNAKWIIKKPYDDFPKDVRNALENIMISFKGNNRVINKTNNKTWKIIDGKKQLIKQTEGDNWAIRKPLHKETVYGKVNIKENNIKFISLQSAIANPTVLIDKDVKKVIISKLNELEHDVKQVQAFFKKNPILHDNKELKTVAVYEWVEGTASRKSIDTTFTEKKIKSSITDTGVQKIMLNHLAACANNPEVAFTPEGIEEMNKNIMQLNDGKAHKPIYKVRIYEAGNRFALGTNGNKNTKFVEAEKGTNLYFAIYKNAAGDRVFDSIALKNVIEHQKQVANLPKEQRTKVPIDKAKCEFLFYLSPNDLVYVPIVNENEETEVVDFNNITTTQKKRIYKMVSCTGNQCMFIPAYVANSIVNANEFSSSNKMERALTGEMIKNVCIKLEVNRLGKIKPHHDPS